MIKIAHARQTFGYYFLLIIIGLDVAIIGPTLLALSEQTGSTISAIGAVFLAGSIGYTIGTMAGGWSFDHLPGHFVLGLAELLAAVMLICVPFAPSLEVLLIILTLKGIANGFVNTGSNTLLLWTHGENSAPYMNALHFFFGLGAFLSPILVAQLLLRGGTHREVFWIVGVLAALVSLYLFSLPGSPRPAHIGDENDNRPTNLRSHLPMVLAAMFFLFFYVGSEITFGSWIYTYAIKLNLADPITGAYLNSGFWLSFTAGRLISIAIATRFHPQQVILVALIGCMTVLGLAIAFPGSNTLLWLAVIGLGFFMAPIFANGLTLAGQSIPLSARLTSIILLGDSIGGMVLPSLTGPVLDGFGPQAMPWLVLGSLALNLAVFFILVRLRQKKTALQPA